jgi:hypothetical protein
MWAPFIRVAWFPREKPQWNSDEAGAAERAIAAHPAGRRQIGARERTWE